MATYTKTLDEYRDSMHSNGYAYFNQDEFNKKSDEVCYIPENAECLAECFSYNDLAKEVDDYLVDNSNYLDEHQTTKEDIINGMFENLEWTFPSTYLAELEN